MSTKDNLINVGLLAAGGVAIAAAAGVYSRGSRAIGDSVRVGADNVVPWTAEQMYDANLVRLSVPPVSTHLWKKENWVNWVNTASGFFAYVAGRNEGLAAFTRNGGRLMPSDDLRFSTREGAQRHVDALAERGGHYEVVVTDVVPADRVKGSRATTWEPKGDDFRRADVAYPDEVEVLYVSELRMYLPYVKLGDHVLSFDAALPLARAKTEASQAYNTQRDHNDYVGRNPYPKSRSKS
jgi:hypothetical protein